MARKKSAKRRKEAKDGIKGTAKDYMLKALEGLLKSLLYARKTYRLLLLFSVLMFGLLWFSVVADDYVLRELIFNFLVFAGFVGFFILSLKEFLDR